jgi:hypothetical protein
MARRGIVGAVCVLLVVVVVGGLVALHHRLTTRTSVEWVGGPQCTGTTLEQRAEDPDTAYVVPRAGMSCRLRFRLHNGGPVAVRVESIRMPFVGPGGGFPVRVASLAGIEPVADDRDMPENDGESWLTDVPSPPVDALFRTGWRLEAGRSRLVSVSLVFHAESCQGSEGWARTDVPVVTFGTVGWSWSHAAAEPLALAFTPESLADMRPPPEGCGD